MARAEEVLDPRMLRALLGAIAHDIRTPLGTLAMVTARLQKTEDVVDARADATVLARAIVRIEAVLRNVVDCLHVREGTLALDREAFDLGALVRGAVDAARSSVPDRTIAFDGAEADSLDVFADRGRIRQVVDCLVHDAIKLGGETGAVLVRVTREDEGIVVSVQDEGPGFAPDVAATIFSAPWESASARPILSLYVCHGIVEAHGGRLWLESALGEGATFSFVLPHRS